MIAVPEIPRTTCFNWKRLFRTVEYFFTLAETARSQGLIALEAYFDFGDDEGFHLMDGTGRARAFGKTEDSAFSQLLRAPCEDWGCRGADYGGREVPYPRAEYGMHAERGRAA